VAERVPGGYRLTGNKQWITSGDRAGVIVVWARTDGGKADKRSQAGGLSAFIVEGGAQGLVAGRPEHKLGLKGSTTVPLLLDGCFVPESARLGNEGDGFKVAMTALDSGRITVASTSIGLAQAALDYALKYTLERTAFGKHLAEFQGIQFMLADMAAAVESARLVTRKAAYLRDQGLPFNLEASMAKLLATDAAMKVTTDAVQIYGGYGTSEDYPVQELMREAKIGQIVEGTNQIQRMLIARELLKKLRQ
jgi:alkylation response protein AidB-like acyl-CoA dehydrogenase